VQLLTLYFPVNVHYMIIDPVNADTSNDVAYDELVIEDFLKLFMKDGFKSTASSTSRTRPRAS
jgi:hypothetical protein